MERGNDATLRVGLAWWWRWVYLPLTLFGIVALGVRPSPDVLDRDCRRAVVMRVGTRKWWQRW